MKASELIALLQAAVEKHGDCEVRVNYNPIEDAAFDEHTGAFEIDADLWANYVTPLDDDDAE
jgi:hypothetical protein